jgi:hypothetical protein
MPFEVSLKFHTLNQGDSLENLEFYVRDLKGHYLLEREDQNCCSLHFWDKNYAEAAQKKL